MKVSLEWYSQIFVIIEIIINKIKLPSRFSNVKSLDSENCSSFNSKNICVIKKQMYIKWPKDFTKM